MILVPLAVVWGGYTLAFYGWAMLQGPGIGFTDLILPNRVGKVESALSTLTAPSGPLGKGGVTTIDPSNPQDPSNLPGSPGNPARSA